MADCHEAFRAWAQNQNIKIHPGIRAASIAGKGIGIVATELLKVGNPHLLGSKC
jgi:hypothetical protein